MEEDPAILYNPFITSKGNIVWAGAMQLAWNELKEKFTKNKSIQLEINSPEAQRTTHNFNLSQFSRKEISEQSIYIKSGYGKATLDLINKEAVQKFPTKTFPPLTFPLSDTDIISYAYLAKSLVFPVQFSKRADKSFKFNKVGTQSFYAQNQSQKKQILVDKYTDPLNFLVHMSGKGGKDDIYLLKSSKNHSVDDVIAQVQDASLKHPISLAKSDTFQMPVVRLDEQRDYSELIGAAFKNPQLSAYFIRIMKEKIKLQVTHAGAKVQNEAVMALSRSSVMHVQKKQVILDRDFWIVMKQPKKHPYLCVLIRSPL